AERVREALAHGLKPDSKRGNPWTKPSSFLDVPVRADVKPMQPPLPPGPVVPVAVFKEPKTFAMRFKDASWDDVLDWYSKESGLTMITTVKPTGKFTFEPPAGRKYTLEEVTDILNEELTKKRFLLIRRHMTFFIHPADEKVDGMAWRTELSELSWRGRNEIIQ